MRSVIFLTKLLCMYVGLCFSNSNILILIRLLHAIRSAIDMSVCLSVCLRRRAKRYILQQQWTSDRNCPHRNTILQLL